jgi:hypothetical protein
MGNHGHGRAANISGANAQNFLFKCHLRLISKVLFKLKSHLPDDEAIVIGWVARNEHPYGKSSVLGSFYSYGFFVGNTLTFLEKNWQLDFRPNGRSLKTLSDTFLHKIRNAQVRSALLYRTSTTVSRHEHKRELDTDFVSLYIFSKLLNKIYAIFSYSFDTSFERTNLQYF